MYARFQENRRIEMSVQYTAKIEAKEEGKREGRQEGKQEDRQERNREIAKTAILEGLDNAIISKLTGLPIEHIEQLRNEKEYRLYFKMPAAPYLKRCKNKLKTITKTDMPALYSYCAS